MSAWMGAEKPVAGALHLVRFKDPWYILLKPISWKPAPGQGVLPAIDVPKGFTTDFASIPQVFWTLLRPDGEYSYPAIIHDYLYWSQRISRDKADKIFNLAMGDFGIDTITKTAVHGAVRAGGGPPWQRNAEAKARGEKRVLKRFPEDPRVTFTQWRKEPDVFADE